MVSPIAKQESSPDFAKCELFGGVGRGRSLCEKGLECSSKLHSRVLGAIRITSDPTAQTNSTSDNSAGCVQQRGTHQSCDESGVFRFAPHTLQICESPLVNRQVAVLDAQGEDGH